MSAAAVLTPLEPRAASATSLGVIDLGSNTARLVVFEATAEGGLRTVFEAKEVPRLGKDVGSDRSLSAAAMERGVATMGRFARQLVTMGDPATVAVATSAIRDAPNGPVFVDRVARRTGLVLRIVSGEEEARLGYLGVASSWELDRDLVADLGGGSLQLATTREGRLETGTSLPLGALRLTQDHLRHDPPKRRELESLRDGVRDLLAGTPFPRATERGRVFGVGGTIRSLARVAMGLRDFPIQRVHGYRLTTRDLEVLADGLFEMDAERRRALPGLSSSRADVVVAGLIVLEELLRRAGKEGLVVCGTGIREGAAVERLGIPVPVPQELLTYRSVTAAARAFGFSLVHGEQVRRLALALFDRLQPRFGWTAADRLVLSVAAWMHDVGAAIDPWRHPQHSAYIIRNLATLALTDRDGVMASLVAYLHEGDEVPEGWTKAWRPLLSPEELATVRRLGTLLYFAETLDGARVRLGLSRGARRLWVVPERSSGWTVPSRVRERLRKPMKRVLDLELVTANDG